MPSVKELLKGFRTRKKQDGASSLDLSGTDLSNDDDFDAVLKVINDEKPSSVRLGGCGLTDEHIKKLAQTLEKNGSKLVALFLENNKIGSAGLKSLMKGLQSAPACAYLNLLGNRKMGAKSTDTLCEAFMNNKAMVSLCGVWPKRFPASKTLKITDTNAIDARLLAVELGKGKSDLLALEVSTEQGDKDNVDYEALFHALEFNTKLISLSCSGFSLDAQSAAFVETFHHALSTNATLKTLTLVQGSTASTEARQSLAKLLKSLSVNRGLTSLRLDGFNILSSEGDDLLLASELSSALKSHKNLLHLALYREEFLDDKRKSNAKTLVSLLSKALGRSNLRLFRVTTHASVDEAVSKKKQTACDALVEALVEATEEPANKRKKSLLIRFNDEEHLAGDVPAGREEVEFFDFEVGDDHIHFIQDESAAGGAPVLCKVLAIAEAHDHEGAATAGGDPNADVYLHYDVMQLDASLEVHKDASPANFVEMFSVNHLVRPFTLKSLDEHENKEKEKETEKEKEKEMERSKKSKKSKKKDATTTDEEAVPSSKKSKKSKKKDATTTDEEAVPSFKKSKKSKKKEATIDDDGAGLGKKSEVKKEKDRKADKELASGKNEPAKPKKEKPQASGARMAEGIYPALNSDQIVAVRFYGCAEYQPAAVLHADEGQLVDVLLMDGSDRIERVEETMLRQVDQQKVDMPPKANADEGFFQKGDLVAVDVHLDEDEAIAKVKEVLSDGKYDLVEVGGSGMGKQLDLTNIPGRLMRHCVHEGDQVVVVMGRQDALKATQKVERGIVVARKNSNDSLDQYAVDVSGKVVRVGARQVMPADRVGARNCAIEEFLSYSKELGLFKGDVLQESAEAQAKAQSESQTAAFSGGSPRMTNLSRDELQRRAEIEATKEAEAAAFDDALEGFPYKGSHETKVETPVQKRVMPRMAHLSSGPDPRDSPEFRFGAGQARQRSQDDDEEDYHHAIIMLGSQKERTSSFQAHGNRPTAKQHFAHSGNSRLVGSGFKEFPQDIGILKSATMGGFGGLDGRPSSTGSAKPMPPSYPRASHTAPGRMRDGGGRVKTVNGPGVPESVEALHDEITDIQQALDAEAEILRKAMALLESRKHGSILQGLNIGDVHSFNNRVTGAPVAPSPFTVRAAESAFPYQSVGATATFGSGVLSPIKTASFLGNYPAPVSALPGFTPFTAPSAGEIERPSPDRSRAGSPMETPDAPESPVQVHPQTPVQVHPQNRMTHMQISGMCVVAKQKGVGCVRDFVEEAFGKSDVGVSDVLTLLAANGFEAKDTLAPLFTTLAESVIAKSPSNHFRAYLRGDLLSGHAQKLISAFSDMQHDANSLRRFQL